MYWGFDIGVLWASFHAFGHSPPGAVLVLGYSVDTLAKPLPFPGGSAGVEGGMIGAFPAFREWGATWRCSPSSATARCATSYRRYLGAIAYWRLRGQFRHRPADDEPRQAVLSG
jgi:hypothetical protein